MIDFLKQRKIVIIIAILVIILISWKMYDSYKFNSKEENEILVSNKTDEKDTEMEEKELIIVHVTGEVKKPGVVKIEQGSRLEDIIKEAGGLTEKADITNVNLAYAVEDGTKIRIPSTDDEDNKDYITQDIGEGIVMQEENTNRKNSIININVATEIELEELPGIGASIASRIVEYRNNKGKFKNIEDIKNVTGIGDNKFEKIKDLIKVK